MDNNHLIKKKNFIQLHCTTYVNSEVLIVH